MNNFRLQRLERTVYQSRRSSLVQEYDAYVTRSPRDSPSFDLLPDVEDVARFLPFRNIIRAPEETPMDDELFESAFAQLPELVHEWKSQLDAEVAQLVEIPSNLSLKDARDDQSFTGDSEISQTPTGKLRLACAVFYGRSRGIFTYPEVLFTSVRYYGYPLEDEDDSERTGSIWSRFGFKYVEEAPYVIHACGLDPAVATVEDMDRRNARFKCLSCEYEYSRFFDWREAVRDPLY